MPNDDDVRDRTEDDPLTDPVPDVTSGPSAPEQDAEAGASKAQRGERRGPMAIAVLGVGILHEFLPTSFQLAAPWIYPTFLLLFLVVLVIGDPGRMDRDRRWLRVVTGIMIAVITLVNAFTAIRLVVDIFDPKAFSTAQQLLTIGAVVWGTNIVAFALWFWDLDGGGAAARALGSKRIPPAFIFPEMSNPEHVPAGWYPQFIDYLAMSFNTGTSFSPTDVSAVRRWAKALMIAESAISLALATLVVARAINMM